MTTKFTDRKGREWDIALDLRVARVIDKSDFKEYWDQDFSILELNKGLIQKLVSDAPFLFAIIWAMVQDQAEAKFQTFQSAKQNREERGYSFKPPGDSFPLSPKDAEAAELEFVSGINGPVIEAGRMAFMEALGDFFPEQRTALFTLMTSYKSLNEKVGKKMETAVPLLEEMMDEIFDKKLADLKVELAKVRDSADGELSSPLQPMQESPTPISG